MAIKKVGLSKEEIRMIYAGDLLAQTIASSFGIIGFEIPVYGLYGACATMGEAPVSYTHLVSHNRIVHTLCFNGKQVTVDSF